MLRAGRHLVQADRPASSPAGSAGTFTFIGTFVFFGPEVTVGVT
jgi:hypothetical protein